MCVLEILMSFKSIETEIRGGTAIISLATPDNMNAGMPGR
jgi:hypothetical protein